MGHKLSFLLATLFVLGVAHVARIWWYVVVVDVEDDVSHKEPLISHRHQHVQGSHGLLVLQGRRDGLGNRLEEVMLLQALCEAAAHNGGGVSSALYQWNNPTTDKNDSEREYAVHFACKDVRVVAENYSHEETAPRLVLTPTQLRKNASRLGRDRLRAAATHITPTFAIRLSSERPVVGVHIRGGDRIVPGNAASKDFMTQQESEACFSRTVALLRARSPTHVFVCGDDPSLVSRFKQALNCTPPVVFVEAVVGGDGDNASGGGARGDVPASYVDLFALSLCSEVYMCSKFSSFATMASMIGATAPLHSLYEPHQSSLPRFGARVVVEAHSSYAWDNNPRGI